MRISELQLSTHLLDEQKQFYHNLLGLPIAKQRKNEFTLAVGGTKLSFCGASEGEEPIYHFAFNIPKNQLSDAKRWLADKVTLIEKDGQDQFHIAEWSADSIYFHDPAGNVVELIARFNLNNDSSDQFSAKSLLCVSELGVPVEDVKLFSSHIQQELKIQLWRGDEKHFAAVGDEEGLLIIVPIGRKWFPTDVPAEYYDVSIDPT